MKGRKPTPTPAAIGAEYTEVPALAGPVYHPAPTPLKTGSLRQIVGRAGAYAYRDVPSLIGTHRVDYVSSLVIDAGITSNE